MPRVIDRNELRRLAADGARIVEVLPAYEYEEEHIPGAISLPLRRLERHATQLLDREQAIVVYCWDSA
jgi:rhodanese-related sulfurtransferase